MGWGNSQRRRGAAPRHYNLPPPGPGLLIRQTGIAYGDGRPDAERDTIPTRVRVYSLDGEPLGESTVNLPPGEQDEPIAVRVDLPPSESEEAEAQVRHRLERGIHIPERGFFRLEGATDDPHTPIGGDVLLTRASRQRHKIPIYNLTTGQPLPDVKGGNLAIHFDNAVFHSLFPDAELAIVRIPRPPDRASPVEIAEHQARMRELVEQGIEIDGQRYDLVLATGARKHGDFLFAHTPYWKKIAPTFEKIMAYGGIMLTSCREPPRQFKHLRVLIVEKDGEYGTGDCNAKMADWLFEEFGQQSHRFRAGQFRLLAEREDESGMVVVGKGTIKRMDHQDVDERGQPYDLILPESSLKGNSPGPGEYVWDTTHLGFNAWSERRRVKFSYQYLQWLSPDNIRALFPRIDSKVEVLKEAMTSTEGARKLLRIARKEPLEQSQELEERPVPELLEALAGQEMDEEEEFRILDTILAGDQSDVMVHHPYVRHKLRQIMRRVWHDLAIGGGVEVPSFTWQPDSFRDKMDWIPLRHIICPELPDGEVASFRYPIRTRHDDQIWYNLTSVEAMRRRGEGLTSPYREYQANYRDALKRAEYAGPTPARQRKIQAAREEMAALQARLEEAQRPVEPPARGTPEYWTWRPEMLEAKRCEQQETISHLQAQVEALAQRIEKLQAPTAYQAGKKRRSRREAGEWQRKMQEEAESERYQAGLQLLKLAEDKDTRAFFDYARRHKGVAYLSHQTAKLVGGDFDGDTGQHIPLPKEYKSLEEIERPDRDFSDLYPIFQQMKEERWGQVETTEKIKRRLATHWAPEDESELTEDNRLWLDGAIIEMTGHRQELTAALIERVRHALHENEAVRTYEEVRTGQRSRLPPGFWQGEEGQRNARAVLTHLIAGGELDPDAPLTRRRLQKLHLSSVAGQQVFAEGLRPVVEETDQQVIEINEIIEGTLKEQRSMDSALEMAEEYGLDVHAWVTERTDLAQEETFDLATQYNRRQMATQALKNMDNSVGLVTYTIARVNAESDPLNLVDLSGVVWREGKSVGRGGVTSWIEEHVAESVTDAQLVGECRAEFTAALTRHVNQAIHGNEAVRTYEEVRAGRRSRLPRGFWQEEQGRRNARAVLTHLVANGEFDPGAPLKEQLGKMRLATVGRVFAGNLEAMVGRAGREAARTAADLQETEAALGLARKYGFDTHAWTDARRESILAGIQAARGEMERQENEIANLRAEGKRARKALDKALQRYDETFNRVLEIGDRYGLTREEIAARCKEQVLNQLGFEQQQEVDKFKYDTGADMEYVNGLSRLVETPAWLAEHKKPDVFVDRAVFSEHDDAQSALWNHVNSQFEAYDPPPMPLEFYRDQLPGNFTPEQYDQAYERVRQYNRTIGTALGLRREEEEAEKRGELAELLAERADGEVGDRVLKTAIQDLAEWSEGITEDRASWACAFWHAAHNAAIDSQDRRMSRYQEAVQRARTRGETPPGEPAYATASAAFHAFQEEITDLLEQIERQPGTEVTITGVQHHLTQEEMDGFNDEGRVVQIEIALETPELETRTGGAKVSEQRLTVYRLEDGGRQWIGVVPHGNAGNVEPGRYQAHLKRRLRQKLKEGQSQYANSLHGTLAPAPVTPASPPPSEVRRLLISGSRRMDRAGLEYARTLVGHARSRGWEIIVGDNPQGVDAEVIRAAIEEGYDDHLAIYGAYRRCRIKDTGRAQVTLTDGDYTRRDRIMAGRCDVAVGVWNGNSPGTQKAIASAAGMGKHAFLMARGTEGWSNRLPGDDDIFSME